MTKDLLVLWDIDHTLMDVTPFRTSLYGSIVTALTGRIFQGVAATPGLNTVEKIRRTFLAHDVIPTPELIAKTLSSLERGYRDLHSELIQNGHLLPGALSILTRYNAEQRLTQGIVTGNGSAIARAKLNSFEIAKFFDFRCSSFGDDTFDRARLIRAAYTGFCRTVDNAIPIDRVILVADTCHDMRAAISVGAHAIGVATGKYSGAELLHSGACLVLPDLTDTRKLDQLIFDPTISAQDSAPCTHVRNTSGI